MSFSFVHSNLEIFNLCGEHAKTTKQTGRSANSETRTVTNEGLFMQLSKTTAHLFNSPVLKNNIQGIGGLSRLKSNKLSALPKYYHSESNC